MNENFMFLAIKEAYKTKNDKEIPVGAVIVQNNKILSKSRNNRQKKCFVLGHAEVNAIIKAEKKLKDWRLNNCDLYVTLEPCEMCKAIIKEARIKNVYYIVSSDKKNNLKINNYIKISNNSKEFNEYILFFQNYFKNLR